MSSAKREALYAEFIREASKRRAEAWSHHAETPEVIAGLYSGVERMRLTSSSEVIRSAEQVVRHVIDAYAAPDKTFDDLLEAIESETLSDPLRHFSEACRSELYALCDSTDRPKTNRQRSAAVQVPERAAIRFGLQTE